MILLVSVCIDDFNGHISVNTKPDPACIFTLDLTGSTSMGRTTLLLEEPSEELARTPFEVRFLNMIDSTGRLPYDSLQMTVPP